MCLGSRATADFVALYKMGAPGAAKLPNVVVAAFAKAQARLSNCALATNLSRVAPSSRLGVALPAGIPCPYGASAACLGIAESARPTPKAPIRGPTRISVCQRQTKLAQVRAKLPTGRLPLKRLQLVERVSKQNTSGGPFDRHPARSVTLPQRCQLAARSAGQPLATLGTAKAKVGGHCAA